VVAFTPQRTAYRIRDQVVQLHNRRWWSLRAAALLIERRGDMSHVFGGLDASHYLALLGRRPILFTAAIPAPPLPLRMYERVAHFVVESSALERALLDAGVSSERVTTIYPAVDLTRYAASPPPPGRFRLLFASTPADPAELEQRGIGLLIDVARACPEIDVVLLWRRWGDTTAAMAEIAFRQPPANLRIEHGDAADMAAIYRAAHATVCCFEKGFGKSAPNSVIEGMASARPALVTDTCGIADLVAESGAGVVTPRTVAGLVEGLAQLQRGYAAAAGRARGLAEEHFDRSRALRRYAQIYDAVAARERVDSAGAAIR
jgi:glycosyltransferase involved in cell wall biosynthesis